jgi:hypothetical protein
LHVPRVDATTALQQPKINSTVPFDSPESLPACTVLTLSKTVR